MSPSQDLSLEAQVHRRQKRNLDSTLGSFVLGALVDPEVVEICLNPPERGEHDGMLWVDSLRDGMKATGIRLARADAENMICTIATLLKTTCNAENPILEGELPFYGSRFEGILPPVVKGAAFSIRKHCSLVIPLEQYVTDEILTARQAEILRKAIDERWNILISGGTGSGKTTFMNALLNEIVERGEPSQRLLVLEDTVELQTTAKNVVAMRTTDETDLNKLVRACMRLRPDRIIVGETRGHEALELLKAWGTGHPGGVTSIHADNALGALKRLDRLAQEGTKNGASQAELVGDTVDLVVQIQKNRMSPRGRRVTETGQVRGWRCGQGFLIEEIR